MKPKTSSNDVTFIERSTVIEAFGLNRAIGVADRQWGDNWSLNYGVYGQDVNHYKGGDEQLNFNTRFNYAPIISDDKLVSFGGSIAAINLPEGEVLLVLPPRLNAIACSCLDAAPVLCWCALI